jgi:hypothetical protein
MGTEVNMNTLDKLNGLAEEIIFHDAEEFVAFLASGRLRSSTWVFRGQSNAEWPLQSSLERFARKMARTRMSESIESHHLHEFRRRASHYTNNHPKDDNLLEWLALMRHHGSPSRLLDFSRSPYVAAFFAAEEATRNDRVAIWAIDARELRCLSAWALAGETCADYVDVGKHCIEDPAFSLCDPQIFSRLIGGIGAHSLVPRHGPIPRVVFPVEPRSMSERTLLQQGLFLFPTSLECGFQECLADVLTYASRWIEEGTPRERVLRTGSGVRVSGKYIPEKRTLLCKLVLEPSAHPHLLRELHRMGLSYASLTPGLDGLARSLITVSKIRGNWTPSGQGPDFDFDAGLY